MNSFQKKSILDSCRNLEFKRAFAIAKVMGMSDSGTIKEEAEVYKAKVAAIARQALDGFLDKTSGNVFFGYAKEIIEPKNAERWRRGYAKHMLRREEEMAQKAISKARAAVATQLDSWSGESLANFVQDFLYVQHGYQISENLIASTFPELMPVIKPETIEANIEIIMAMN